MEDDINKKIPDMIKNHSHPEMAPFIEAIKKHIFLSLVLLLVGCGNSNNQPVAKKINKSFLLMDHSQEQEKLKAGTFQGCVYITATNFIQKIMVGFKFTGEICDIEVNEDNTVKVSFLRDEAISLVGVKIEDDYKDLFIGDLENNQALVIEHYKGALVSVIQTSYDKNGDLIYGSFERDKYIKRCGFFPLTTTDKLTGRKNC